MERKKNALKSNYNTIFKQKKEPKEINKLKLGKKSIIPKNSTEGYMK